MKRSNLLYAGVLAAGLSVVTAISFPRISESSKVSRDLLEMSDEMRHISLPPLDILPSEDTENLDPITRGTYALYRLFHNGRAGPNKDAIIRMYEDINGPGSAGSL